MGNSKKSKTYATQVFYLNAKALQIQISNNGIFFEIAPELKGTDRYDWEKKNGAKFSINEICNMLYAVETFRTKGEEGYIKVSQNICGEKYKNMQFVHKNRRQEDVRTGLNLYNGNLSFIINNKAANVNVNFPIMNTEKIRFEKFLNFIINTAFQKGL